MPEPHADDERTAADRPDERPAPTAPADASPAAVTPATGAADATAPLDAPAGASPDGTAGSGTADAPADAPGADPDDRAEPAVVPSEDELARIATPATLRRAPRYRAFLVTGGLVGAVVGLVLAFLLADGSGVTAATVGMLPLLDGQNGVRAVCAVGGALVGTFAGGALALAADRRSTRGRR